MKKLFTILILLGVTAFGQTTTVYLYHSHSNNWAGNGMSGSWRDLGVKSWRFTFQSTWDGNNYYKIYNQSENFDNNFESTGSKVWSSNLTPNNSGSATISAYEFGNGGAAFFPIENTMYYSLIWKDVSTSSNSKGFVLKTSAQPVTVTNVTNNYSAPNNDVTVTVTTSSAKSTEEKIFVRYTTDNFNTWGIVEATSGSNPYTATIPGVSVTGTSTNKFYVFTTTLSLLTVSGFSAEDIDLATLHFGNNGGFNYALPVELTSFNAAIRNGLVDLKWETATEVNNYGFEVERKTATADWSKIGFVEGHNSTNSPKYYSYSDKPVGTGKIAYRLKQIDNDGQFEYSPVVEVLVDNLPNGFVLEQNYPNPFNPETSIRFALKEDTKTTLKVYNSLGAEIATLFDGTAEAGRYYDVKFSGSDLASGFYIYKLVAGEYVSVKKMLLMK